jgi:hypothetical protein
MFGALVPESRKVDAREQVFSGPEQDRRNRQVHLVDQPGLKILPDGGHSSAQADVFATGGISGPLQGLMNVIHEAELRPAFHSDRPSCVMGEYEDRRVICRVWDIDEIQVELNTCAIDSRRLQAKNGRRFYDGVTTLGEMSCHER